MSCYITYKGKNYTQEDFLDFLKSQIPALSTSNNPSEFINHSGGAKGYDAEWDLIGAEFGMINNKHYLLPSDGAVSDSRLQAKGVKPVDATNDVGPVALQGPATGEAQIAVTNAERIMGRIEPNHTTRNTKKIRNYAQVKNADAIFAIGSLIPKGADITIARGQATKKALVPQVNGGTSVAVQLGITMGKPTYVFNQAANSTYSQGWYKWDNTKQDFVSINTPTLTKNFAGIGTSSNTTEAGKQAIRDVYENTFKESKGGSKQEIKPGVEELFESNPELASIGTQEQYSQYLNTIFPDSEVKDIVYHGTNRTEKSFEKRIPDDAYGSNAIYFANKKYAETFGNLIPSLLNITAPLTPELKFNRRRLKPGFVSPAGTADARDLLYENSNNDGLIGVDYSDTENSTYVVKEPEQIHILGSKQDIEGFRNYVNSTSSNNETSTDTYQYFGAKYEIITVDGVGVQVKDYKGSHQNQQKLLQAYNNNKDIDPQTGRKFRNLSPLEELKQKITGGTSDTLNLSKYELFPGVYANEGQRAAIDAIEEFLAGDKEIFLLKGRGGTGKTTIVKKTIGEIPVKKVAGATIAYEAKNVLQENMVGYNTFTMASLIGLMPDWAKDGTMFFREKTIAERSNPSTGEIYPLPIEGKKLIIVDEASMIDSFIYEKLLEKKDKDAKILFMGDNVQIPPINSRVDEDGNVIDSGEKDSPVWGLVESGDYVELSERMRQGAESPILPITDLYAENVENLQNDRPGIDNPLKDRNSNFENNEGVLFTTDVNELTDQFIEDIRSSTDIREAVIVGARNAVVDEINDRVRNKLFETNEAYVIGDRLRVNSPHMEGKELIYPNGLRVEVLGVREIDTSDLGFKMFELETSYTEVAEDGSNKIIRSYMRTISPKDKSLFSKKIKEMAAKAKALPKGSPESKRAWKQFFDIKNSVVDLGYGYAITAHKVQGSTYNSAYVLEGDIMSFPGGIEQRNRMMYTAVSRPRKKLVIFNPNKVENKDTNKPQAKPVAKDTAAKIRSLFDRQGFIEIDTANKTNKELIVIISNYVLEELGHVTPQEKLGAVQSGFKLSNYITTEEISPTRTRVKTNMRNLLKDEVEDTPISLGDMNFTSGGDSYAKNAFTCK